MIYPTPSWLLAFSVGKGVHGTEPGIDARQTGLCGESLQIPSTSIMIPRQTHSTNVCWVDTFGEVADTDAVITDKAGLCIAVKTADCIPVLLFDQRQFPVFSLRSRRLCCRSALEYPRVGTDREGCGGAGKIL